MTSYPVEPRTSGKSMILSAAAGASPLDLARIVLVGAAMSGPHAGLARADPPALAPGYRAPPAAIAAMVDAAPMPEVRLSPTHQSLAILGLEGSPSAAAMAKPVLRLAGYRINPRTNGPAEIRIQWFNALSFQSLDGTAPRQVRLPDGMRFMSPAWAPDGKSLAFVAEAPQGLELWVADPSGAVKRLTGPVLNAAAGDPFRWLPDSTRLLVRTIDTARVGPPETPDTPPPPLVQETAGRTSGARTYEDLLKTPQDAALFRYAFTSRLAVVGLSDDRLEGLGKPGIITGFALSPDGRYVLTESMTEPFSTAVPASRFPVRFDVVSLSDGLSQRVGARALAEAVPAYVDGAPMGPREMQWRSDAPAQLVWAEAQDGGDPRRDGDVRDRVFSLTAPFDGTPRTLVDLPGRLDTLFWGADRALATARWWKTRAQTWTAFDPAGVGPQHLLIDRNLQDPTTDPGSPLLMTGPFGAPVMQPSPGANAVLMAGEGSTASDNRPFLATLDTRTGAETLRWRSGNLEFEVPIAVLDVSASSILTRRESQAEPPNYFVRRLATAPDRPGSGRQITHFADPLPLFASVRGVRIAYARSDGLPLSGTLYLPPGYVVGRDPPAPLLMWAYPTDYLDAATAGRTVDPFRNRFIRPAGASPLFLLSRGYAVLDGPSMPIVAPKGGKANDTYVEQLSADAQAAVDTVISMGVADPARIAVGGHSYGAFMTANLLAHTRLFAAGIAESGAYNRTLTPFGFQNEERNYWEATTTYTRMSPFTYVNDIKAPLLLIHGDADDNAGTFPIQSERFFAALKGMGATARYVSLPNEPHTYRGRDSIMDVLAEISSWLDRFVKGATPTARPAAPPADQ